jgi:hypothetical protein
MPIGFGEAFTDAIHTGFHMDLSTTFVTEHNY